MEDAEIMQEEYIAVLTALEKCKPRDSEYKNKKLKLLENVKRFYNWREMIVNAFKNKIFPLYHKENMSEDKDEDYIRDKNGLINCKKLERLIFSGRSDINVELVMKHFLVQDLKPLLKKMKEIKDAEKNKIHASLVRSGLTDLKGEIKKWVMMKKKLKNEMK